MRFQAAVIAAKNETMGKTLLPGEAEGMLNAYAGSTRGAAARAIIQLIYPAGASEAGQLRAKRKYFLSESLMLMANCIVGGLGKLNIGLGMVGTISSSSAEIPHRIFPLAAMLVSFLSFSRTTYQ